MPDLPGLRPTPDRVRETLFNWLGQWLAGLSCLDLFAGSGALGFEAASRGAARVVMVEQSRKAFTALERARKQLGAARIELVFGDAFDYLGRAAERFDVVFLDPPFGQNALPAVLERLPRVLVSGAKVYVEGARSMEPPPGFQLLRHDRAGQVHYHLLRSVGNEEKR